MIFITSLVLSVYISYMFASFYYRYFTSKGSLKSISKKVMDKDLLGGDLDDDDDDEEDQSMLVVF